MRLGLGLVLAGLIGCAPEYNHATDLKYANARVPYQTLPAAIPVFQTDVDEPYDVLGDLEIIVRQRGSMGEMPTREQAIEALRVQAGRIGAHAIILIEFSPIGMSWWSYHELQGRGRAVRFR